ncbi:hypothetical protein B0T18DRAFT_417164 [Schizothecium vesticola]|uniref:Uncharacterized protein n=1 Tax=Schizothecium vesticola TaxID=314040 RepID=A0AA40BTF5_9PEZI|nr:hypothetical protein B0T18DRAFT_417164 [Schizothecium vesticola]
MDAKSRPRPPSTPRSTGSCASNSKHLTRPSTPYVVDPWPSRPLPGGHRGHILPAQPTTDSQN